MRSWRKAAIPAIRFFQETIALLFMMDFFLPWGRGKVLTDFLNDESFFLKFAPVIKTYIDG